MVSSFTRARASDSDGSLQTEPSRQSLCALDLLAMCVGDLSSGVGLYLSIYLLSVLHWHHGAIGMALSTLSIAAIVGQLPAGMLTDKMRHKRLLVAVPLLLLGSATFAIIKIQSMPAVMATQVIAGLTLAAVNAAIIGISLGLVGYEKFARRIGRNEAFNHLGNVLMASSAALIGYFLSLQAVFIFLAAISFVAVMIVFAIKPGDISYERARAAESKKEKSTDEKSSLLSIFSLFKDKNILAFCVTLACWHLANAALCPVAGQYMAESHPKSTGFAMSICILAGQLVMIPTAISCGKLADLWGRKPLLLIAFSVLPLRAILFSFSSNIVPITAVQLLDGVGAGIIGVLTSVVIADITKGSGRYNSARSIASLFQMIGTALSNALAGWLIAMHGYNLCFYILAAIAVVALILCLTTVRESRLPA